MLQQGQLYRESDATLSPVSEVTHRDGEVLQSGEQAGHRARAVKPAHEGRRKVTGGAEGREEALLEALAQP